MSFFDEMIDASPDQNEYRTARAGVPGSARRLAQIGHNGQTAFVPFDAVGIEDGELAVERSGEWIACDNELFVDATEVR